ncbi:protein arginine kinase [Candidatus Oleimmundimicrobium sp.]|uniref:protein arginine kinase n=1 Tax=Candidatus Oleimmundimicrobium sp. TaxID=3060597 RepID=UPI00271C945F|nr:protein arginine kinase [Candidatus Oleimmundimicrobium sp.]MDO8885985.1 protein arginine kinase [Candidatus Oleimmundimicrobium sp.]
MITFKSNFSNWIEDESSDSDVIVSSRVKIARNLTNFTFPHWATEAQLSEVRGFILKAITGECDFNDLILIFSEELAPQKKDILVEKHLISPTFNVKKKGLAVILSEKNTDLCIMINEEDHLCIQAFSSGLQLQKAWKIADEIDERLSSHLPYAFSAHRGYLTERPTNIGTGMRASVMMHLPALAINDEVELLFSNLSNSNITVRGLFGEGTDVAGNFYQVSNQTTIGKSEDEIIDDLQKVSKNIIERERAARQILAKEEKIKLIDEVSRAWGTLTHAKLISFEEAIDYLSMIRLGIDLNILPNLSCNQVTKLMMLIKPAHLRDSIGKDVDEDSELIARANLIKHKLFELREGVV